MEKITPRPFTLDWKGVIIFGLLTGLVGAGCLTGSQPKTSEPSYKGTTLSEWLRVFDYQTSPESQAVAADAIREIGSQAVPYLVELLSEARLKHFEVEMKKWRNRQANASFDVESPANPRQESFAALDALGPMAADALPVLEKLLHGSPPDLQALYIAARVG